MSDVDVCGSRPKIVYQWRGRSIRHVTHGNSDWFNGRFHVVLNTFACGTQYSYWFNGRFVCGKRGEPYIQVTFLSHDCHVDWKTAEKDALVSVEKAIYKPHVLERKPIYMPLKGPVKHPVAWQLFRQKDPELESNPEVCNVKIPKAHNVENRLIARPLLCGFIAEALWENQHSFPFGKLYHSVCRRMQVLERSILCLPSWKLEPC